MEKAIVGIKNIQGTNNILSLKIRTKPAFDIRIIIFSAISCLLCSYECQSAEEGSTKKLATSLLFSDNMVLQRNQLIPVWGWGSPGKTVTVEMANIKVKSIIDKNGKWMVTLPAMKAGGPYEMTIRGEQIIKLKNILLGEVWLCSGQSNMELVVKYCSKSEVAAAKYPNIRLFNVQNTPSPKNAKENIVGKWQKCSPESVSKFSAVAYFFGRDLHNNLEIPIGLINSSVGGSPAESWISIKALKQEEKLSHIANYVEAANHDYKNVVKQYKADFKQWLHKNHIEWNDTNQEFISPEYKEDSSWNIVTPPAYWTNTLFSKDGVAWYRKSIPLPDNWIGKDLTLSLGVIDDCDMVFFNGNKIGETGPDINKHWQIKRTYKIPGRLVQKQNLIAVKVLDYADRGGFHGSAGLMFLKNPTLKKDNKISLANAWSFKLETRFDYSKMNKSPERPIPIAQMNFPTTLYNGMIAPLIPYSIRGVIWYQGESNTHLSKEYQTLFPAMIKAWRNDWNQGDFPFYFVQLASFYRHMPGKPFPANSLPLNPTEESSRYDWARLREAQLMTLSEPNTGMAVTIDIGNPTDVHPKNKLDVGKRLALIARNNLYKQKVQYSGPIYKTMTIKGNKVRLHFDYIGQGLSKKGDKLKYFAIAGKDRIFKWANAEIDGDSVLAWSSEISNPVAVRYAWHRYPEGANLFNKDGLPATPFRTDKW